MTKAKISNELFFSEVENVIQNGYKVKISVQGNSMKPFLNDGDLAILNKVKKKHLYCGDVVLFHYNDSYVLHRIVKIKGNSVMLAGDGNFSKVEKININDVIAKVISVYRDNESIEFRDFRWKIWYKLRFFRLIYSRIFG